MRGKGVLLIIGGGIAAYKSLLLIRLLQKRGISVRAILTRAGAEFVTPLSVGSLTKDKVYQDLFDLTDEAQMGHIALSRSADLVVVAPATADLIAKAANGLANDLASTTLLATDKPVLMAPAMNVQMWHRAATQRNLKMLAADGVAFVGPNDGEMADGEDRPGPAGRAGRDRRRGGTRAREFARAGRHQGAGDRGTDTGAARSRALPRQPLLRQAGLRHRRRAGPCRRADHAGLRPGRDRAARGRENCSR
ncbi:MAG: flavoprotein [Rhizomicrobium sp.]